MKLTVDREADALYLALGPATVARSEEVSPGIIVDSDAEGRVIGIELLHLSRRAADLEGLLVEGLPQAAAERTVR